MRHASCVNGAFGFETLTYTVEDGVALVTLSRPDVLNAVNETMRQELASLPPLLQERNVRVMVFTGAGRAFCAGGDVSMFEEDWRRVFYWRPTTIQKAFARFSRNAKRSSRAINWLR